MPGCCRRRSSAARSSACWRGWRTGCRSRELVAGEFAGWCGFQADPGGADFGLVLRPSHWGHGRAITKRALQIGFADFALDAVLVALPYSRTPDRAMAGLGFAPDGEVSYAGARFRQYRLTREPWSTPRLGA